MMAITKDDIDKVLARFWENQQILEHIGDGAVDPHDAYADAAMVIEMAKDADIPLEELVPSEKDRKLLADYAARAEPYGGSTERL